MNHPNSHRRHPKLISSRSPNTPRRHISTTKLKIITTKPQKSKPISSSPFTSKQHLFSSSTTTTPTTNPSSSLNTNQQIKSIDQIPNQITSNPLNQYSPSRFFEHIHTYPYQEHFYFNSPYGLVELAKSLGRICHNPYHQTNVLLYGDLGTGKTTFSRYFLREVTQSPSLIVPSPTFTLQITYQHNKRIINHMDLYRLGHSDEAHILNLLETYNDNDNDLTLYDQVKLSTATTSLPPQNNTISKSIPFPPPPQCILPNTSKPHQAINLIEWPHVLHNSQYYPQSYIRIDLHDRVTYKEIVVSFHGNKYENYISSNYNDNHSNINENNTHTSSQLIPIGKYIIQQIYNDLGSLCCTKEYVDKSTETIYFGEEDQHDDDNNNDDNEQEEIIQFIPKTFSNSRI